jgi:hypothetical protein
MGGYGEWKVKVSVLPNAVRAGVDLCRRALKLG